MKTEIELAKQAGWEYADDDRGFEPLWRFAELVRADEREKYKWDVHSCGPTCKRYACVAMREAVEAEREACAKVCDIKAEVMAITGKSCDPDDLAAAIRARSNT